MSKLDDHVICLGVTCIHIIDATRRIGCVTKQVEDSVWKCVRQESEDLNRVFKIVIAELEGD